MNLSRLIRIAVGVPIILGISASLAWQLARMSRADREELIAVWGHMFFTGDGGAS